VIILFTNKNGKFLPHTVIFIVRKTIAGFSLTEDFDPENNGLRDGKKPLHFYL
jgi:hypothetical protein